MFTWTPLLLFQKSEALRLRDVWMVQPRHSSPSAWSPIRDLMYTEKTWRTPETSGKLGENHAWILNKQTKTTVDLWQLKGLAVVGQQGLICHAVSTQLGSTWWRRILWSEIFWDYKGSEHGNLTSNVPILKTLNFFRASERCSCWVAKTYQNNSMAAWPCIPLAAMNNLPKSRHARFGFGILSFKRLGSFDQQWVGRHRADKTV